MILLLALLLAQAAEPPGLRLQDEGTAKGTIDTLNCVGTGIACTRAGRKGTLTVNGGGSGSPGGSSGQLQWNNAAAFDGTARVTTDGNDLMLSGQTSVPTGVAGKLTPLAYGLFGPAMPAWAQGDLGFSWSALPGPADAIHAYWGCTLPHWASTILVPSGGATSPSTTPASTSVAWAATDAKTRAPWIGQVTAAAINTTGSVLPAAGMWRGNAAGLGGFWVHGATAVAGAPPSGQRMFFGLATTTISAAADPSAALNTVGFACDTGATTLSVISNDNAGAATVAKALGASFPCTTAGIGYDWWLWATPNASTINWAIREIVGGATDSGTISTDLPLATVFLSWLQWINTGPTTATAASLHVGPVCFVANP